MLYPLHSFILTPLLGVIPANIASDIPLKTLDSSDILVLANQKTCQHIYDN